MKKKKLSFVSKLCFGIGAFGKDAVYALVGTYLMLYLTDFRSVAPAFVGTLFMIARIWDAFNVFGSQNNSCGKRSSILFTTSGGVKTSSFERFARHESTSGVCCVLSL